MVPNAIKTGRPSFDKTDPYPQQLTLIQAYYFAFSSSSTLTTMQFSIIFVTLAAIATIALASPAPRTTAGQCNVGEVQCCNQITKADDPAISGLLNQVGLIIDDLTVAVGVDCNPITVIGAGFGSCNIEPVCCDDNSFGSLVAVGCVPINAA